MMNPRCASGLYREMMVLSFPPCGVPVEVKALPTLPFSLPWNHKPPSESIKAFSSADAFPNRVDRKSTRLNSSHQIISYAVFCLKKKTNAVERYPHARLLKLMRTVHDNPTRRAI